LSLNDGEQESGDGNDTDPASKDLSSIDLEEDDA